MADTILSIRGITKLFPGVRALSDVSLDIERGDCIGLCGENGAGKSTLIKILTGVYQPTAGSIWFDGKEANFRTPLEAQQAGLSVVHQEIKLVNTLSVKENVFLGRPICSGKLVNWGKMRKEAKALLDKLGVELDPDAMVGSLNYIIGKPGVGKSHYVEELTKVHNDAIVYRFWVSAHDEHLRHRLQYDAFLTDIGLKAFKSPRSFRESELVEQLRKKDTLLIIDGLDHVENYNPQELPSYLSFLELLEKSDIRTVVLSRPMKASLQWELIELINWNFSETTIYLAAAHNIFDYDICKKIYECTNGYPIITYFFAEHFNKYGEMNLQIPIDDINVYYNELLKDVATKSALCIFASNNSFFTREELKTFFADPEAYDVLLEFIKAYPYLFGCVKNRISLVHDSLNTYLRCILSSYQKRYEIVKDEVKKSLKAYEVEYMDRLSSFNFDTEFLTQLLIQYSDFNALRKV